MVAQHIKDQLAHYCFSVDSNDLSTLPSIFTADCIAPYPPPLGPMTGYQEMIEKMEGGPPLRTQHSITTQLVKVFDSENEGSGDSKEKLKGKAASLTYFICAVFAEPKGSAARPEDGGYDVMASGADSRVCQFWGNYQDQWVEGEDGVWRINCRNLVYMVSLLWL
jgi:SnoaL-like domain